MSENEFGKSHTEVTAAVAQLGELPDFLYEVALTPDDKRLSMVLACAEVFINEDDITDYEKKLAIDHMESIFDHLDICYSNPILPPNEMGLPSIEAIMQLWDEDFTENDRLRASAQLIQSTFEVERLVDHEAYSDVEPTLGVTVEAARDAVLEFAGYEVSREQIGGIRAAETALAKAGELVYTDAVVRAIAA